MPSFDYATAFSRNLGWLTLDEQAHLATRRVAIAGLGGVGGFHLLALARLGIGRFNLADFDCYELANFNRQTGASVSTLGEPKLDVMAASALDINPGLELIRFPEGVTDANLERFLDGVDLYIDGLDFFAFDIREAVFAACARRLIPVITVAPLGMGAALLNFLPGGTSFDDYFRLKGCDDTEKALRFLLGLAPARLQFGYLVDPGRVDLARRKGPSTVMACHLCAGIAATEALKILLGRGKVLAAPHGVHFDAYTQRLRHTWRPGGNHHPVQRLLLALARRRLAHQPAAAPPSSENAMPSQSKLDAILDTARWAPSGDNTQPWRFEVHSAERFSVHTHDTRDDCVYDLDGHSSHLAVGALLETLDLAAAAENVDLVIDRADTPEYGALRYDITLCARAQPTPDLAAAIRTRSVQRRAMSPRPLSASQKQALEASVPGYRVVWVEGLSQKWTLTRLLLANAELRLTLPEAWPVHRRIIEWNARYSEDRIPDQALGLDPGTLRLMHWVLGSWERVRFFNRYLAGTLMPRVQLDFIPALFCGAHFLLVADQPASRTADFVAAGRAVQRFWLSATRLGLQLQPEVTPLIFSRYIRNQTPFTAMPGKVDEANRLASRGRKLLGEDTWERAVFMGRIGAGSAPVSRSLRLPLAKLGA